MDEAIRASERDLRALGEAGAVIVGTVTVRGNGFAGADYVADAAAKEAARRGGTHVVLGMTLHQSARGQRLQSSNGALQGAAAPAKYYPGKTVELSALVLRLPDDARWDALPTPLRPPHHPGFAQDAARTEPPPPSAGTAAPPSQNARVARLQPLPETSASSSGAAAEATEIDGSHIAPLPASGQ